MSQIFSMGNKYKYTIKLVTESTQYSLSIQRIFISYFNCICLVWILKWVKHKNKIKRSNQPVLTMAIIIWSCFAHNFHWFFTNLIFFFSSAVSVNFPRFYGHSHMTFEPLKNSYQTFQITLEFKARHLVVFTSSFFPQSRNVFEKFFFSCADRLGGWLVALLWRKWKWSWRLYLFSFGSRQTRLQVRSYTHFAKIQCEM